MEYEEFKETFGNHVKELEEAYYGGDKLNIFKILRLDNYEIRHSNFLVWLLKDVDFRKMFIRDCCGINPDELSDSEINEETDIKREDSFKEIDKDGKEILTNKKNNKFCVKGDTNVFEYEYGDDSDSVNIKYIGKENTNEIKYPYQRFIDINIIGKAYTLTIENKVDAEEHDHQCISYKNYMKYTYKGIKNYFVFLAKNKPDNCDPKNPLSRYEGYKIVDYTQVKKVLEEYKKLPDTSYDKKKLINQYLEIIEAWYKFPEEYKNICNRVDPRYFSDKKKYLDVLETAKTDAEKYFVETMHQYCVTVKKENDAKIFKILNNLCKKAESINSEYGTGRRNLNQEEESIPYAHAVRIPDDFFKNRENRYMNTVDYRAIDGFHIMIYAGLTSKFSKQLLEYLHAHVEFLEKAIKLEEDGWKVNVVYRIGNGTNYLNNDSQLYEKLEFDINQPSLIDNLLDKDVSSAGKNKQVIMDCLNRLIANNLVNEENLNKINNLRENSELSDDTKMCSSWSIELDYGMLSIEEITEDSLRAKTVEGLNLFDMGDKFNSQVFK